jgi:NAD(P)-dependent dehydrogenase (short-subunit alcohol dehydrogenase family)
MSDQTKVALVTGGNKGIGLVTVKELAALGYTVLLGARDQKKGEEAAASVPKGNGEVRAVAIDVDNYAHHKALRELIEKDYGKLDVLINNAGIMIDDRSKGNTTTTVPIADIRKTIETNVYAPIALTQELLPLIRKSPAGRIVNLSSILASLTLHATKGSPIYSAKTFAYDMSKAALNSFTIHLAAELADTPIKVNSAHPGWVKTDMGGKNAPMKLEDGAKTSVWLATLPPDGPTGGFFHERETLPW